MYKKKGRKNKMPNKTEFEYRYYILDQSAQEMAKDYGVKPQTIYNWATEFRKKRTVKERSVMHIKKAI